MSGALPARALCSRVCGVFVSVRTENEWLSGLMLLCFMLIEKIFQHFSKTLSFCLKGKNDMRSLFLNILVLKYNMWL